MAGSSMGCRPQSIKHAVAAAELGAAPVTAAVENMSGAIFLPIPLFASHMSVTETPCGDASADVANCFMRPTVHGRPAVVSDGAPRKIHDGWGGYPSGAVGDLLRRPDMPSPIFGPASNLCSGAQSAASKNKVKMISDGGGYVEDVTCRYTYLVLVRTGIPPKS